MIKFLLGFSLLLSGNCDIIRTDLPTKKTYQSCSHLVNDHAIPEHPSQPRTRVPQRHMSELGKIAYGKSKAEYLNQTNLLPSAAKHLSRCRGHETRQLPGGRIIVLEPSRTAQKKPLKTLLKTVFLRYDQPPSSQSRFNWQKPAIVHERRRTR